MIKHLVLLVVTSYCIALQAQKASEEPYLIKTLANETIKHVDVETSAGGITVAAVNPSEAHIEVYIRANDRDEGAPTKEEIKRMLEQDYNLNISVVNNKLVASAKSKERINDWRKALVISFKVFVPKNVSTELNTSGGGISLKGLTGTHIFSTSGGGLHIENVNGIVKGRTSGGGINLINSG
ncbi:MAG TPA: hypothetical protein VM368_01185, partial [Flavisolibacter sp.]|nr:hypothetical protein [Flavisolibacter sp.]